MEEGLWTHSRCTEEPGFPKLLLVCLKRLGIREPPEYSGREYERYGIPQCEVIIHIGRTARYPNIEPLQVSAMGFRHRDTYPVAARKALGYLCQMYEMHLEPTSMRYFPPAEKDHPGWRARMRALDEHGRREEDTTVYHMAAYLVSLDRLYDQQAAKLR